MQYILHKEGRAENPAGGDADALHPARDCQLTDHNKAERADGAAECAGFLAGGERIIGGGCDGVCELGGWI